MSGAETASGNYNSIQDYCEAARDLFRQGRADDALALLTEAAPRYPDSDDIPAAIALILREKGDLSGAVQYGIAAVNANPSETRHKEALVETLGRMRLMLFHPQVKELVTFCLDVRDIDHQKLSALWHTLFTLDPHYAVFVKAGKQKDYKAFHKVLEKIPSLDALAEPFFVLGLQSLLVAQMEFEQFLTWLRRALLERVADGDDVPAALLAALAVYCYRTEYVFSVTEEERALSSELPGLIEGALMHSCYQPFYSIDDADGMAEEMESDPGLGEFLKMLYADPRVQEKIKTEIAQLTPVQAAVSQTVRAQYEGFPYPRWKTLQGSISLVQLENFLSKERVDRLRAPGTQILIAGCGTGAQALEYGMAFPEAQILAVDLSLSSLAYAVQKQRERGIDNVTFKQADILELPDTLGPFELIVSTGVLHHMEDPFAGWQALTRLLRPGGMMRIALYSEIARQFIVRGRGIIAREGFGDDAAEIRRFREAAPRLFTREDWGLVKHALDWYAMSECRDMLFHVQEHRYTVPQIGEELGRLGLEFFKFEVPAAMREKYRQAFPDDERGNNLAHWDQFERDNPFLFLQMYRFWCFKPE